MRVVAYLRVSTLGQARDGYGLLAQEDACRAFAVQAGHELVAVHREEGISGSRTVADRPALTEALALIQSGDVDALLVARLDRLARSLTVQEAAIGTVWRLGGRVLTADSGEVLPDDPDDPMRQMAGVFAELDRSLLIKRLRDGRRAKQARWQGQGLLPVRDQPVRSG